MVVTPGTADATFGTTVLNDPDPLLFVFVTIRFALRALLTLLVADLDADAPNTAMAETRASLTIRADAVWAVRRGLRMEFSRPSLPAIPIVRASGRPMTLEFVAVLSTASGFNVMVPRCSSHVRPACSVDVISDGTIRVSGRPRRSLR